MEFFLHGLARQPGLVCKVLLCLVLLLLLVVVVVVLLLLVVLAVVPVVSVVVVVVVVVVVANLRTIIMDLGGFASSIISIIRRGILMSIGDFPGSLSQAIFGGIMLVARLGVKMRGWWNAVGNLIEICCLEKAYSGPRFTGIRVKTRGVRFHRIRDFKQY